MKTYENKLNDWVNKEKLGVNLLNSVGKLMYDRGIELVLFRNQLLWQLGVWSKVSMHALRSLGMHGC